METRKRIHSTSKWTELRPSVPVFIFSPRSFAQPGICPSVPHKPIHPPSPRLGVEGFSLTPSHTHRQAADQIILLRLCVGESVMTSLHWVEFRFLVPPPPAEAEPVESRCSAISSEMKVFRSTSWSPLRLLRHTGPEPEDPPTPAPPPLLLLPLTCVGDPGAPERTLILAMAPLRPCSAMASLKGWRSASTDEPVSAGELARLGATIVSRGLALLLLCGGALPHRKLIRSSLRMVLRRFFTQANMSLLRRWWPIWMPRSKLL